MFIGKTSSFNLTRYNRNNHVDFIANLVNSEMKMVILIIVISNDACERKYNGEPMYAA